MASRAGKGRRRRGLWSAHLLVPRQDQPRVDAVRPDEAERGHAHAVAIARHAARAQLVRGRVLLAEGVERLVRHLRQRQRCADEMVRAEGMARKRTLRARGDRRRERFVGRALCARA
eukprot:3467765-Prymnesium_polylepis.1